MDPDEEEEVDAEINQSATSADPIDGDHDEEDDEQPILRNRGRPSKMSRRSGGTDIANTTIGDYVGGDYDGDDHEPLHMDYDDGDAEPLQGFEDGDDDVALEQAAIDAENEDGSGDEPNDEPLPKRRGRPPKANKHATKVVRRQQTPNEVQRPLKTRVSRLPHEREHSRNRSLTPVDPNVYTGDFRSRRSGRTHFAPLQYWKNEKFEYKQGEIQPIIVGIERKPDEPIKSRGHKRYNSSTRGRSRSRAKSGTRQMSVESDGDGADDTTNPVGTVALYGTENEEVERREWTLHKMLISGIAMPKSRIEMKSVDGAEFLYQKVFGEDQFIAGGFVYLPVKTQKPGKPSRDNAYVSDSRMLGSMLRCRYSTSFRGLSTSRYMSTAWS